MSHILAVAEEVVKFAPVLGLFIKSPEFNSVINLISGVVSGNVSTTAEFVTQINSDDTIKAKFIELESKLIEVAKESFAKV